jgi:hypothetical protein
MFQETRYGNFERSTDRLSGDKGIAEFEMEKVNLQPRITFLLKIWKRLKRFKYRFDAISDQKMKR